MFKSIILGAMLFFASLGSAFAAGNEIQAPTCYTLTDVTPMVLEMQETAKIVHTVLEDGVTYVFWYTPVAPTLLIVGFDDKGCWNGFQSEITVEKYFELTGERLS